jgi:polyisoprenoid-binding protein YceI
VDCHDSLGLSHLTYTIRDLLSGQLRQQALSRPLGVAPMSNLSDLSPGTWKVDVSHSEFGFAARRAMVSKIRGQFKDFSAVVTIGRPFEQSTVEATVQMASVDTHGTDRDTHLRSAEFFDVENHPHHDLQVHQGHRQPP